MTPSPEIQSLESFLRTDALYRYIKKLASIATCLWRYIVVASSFSKSLYPALDI